MQRFVFQQADRGENVKGLKKTELLTFHEQNIAKLKR